MLDTMLSKMQIIESIMEVNRSAKAEWLNLFDEISLRRYLEHLQRTIEPRGPHSTWVRQSGTAPVVTRRAAG